MKKLWLIALLLLALAGLAAAEETTEYTCGDARYVLLEDGTAMITGYKGSAETLTIPAKLDGYAVSAIGEGAFYGCTALVSVTIPEGIASIGDHAFESCSALMNINIPESVLSVGQNPFVDCEALRYITVPAKHPVLSVVNGVLFDKAEKRLICYPSAYVSASYTVPADTAVIGDLAFYGSRSLEEVILPESVLSIGESAFEACSALNKINLPGSITEISGRTFAWCSALTEIAIPESVTAIGDEAFVWCRALTYAAVPDSVASIGEGAFAWCPRLTLAVVPGSVAAFWAIEQEIPFVGLI